jgi:hypothetical protein
MTSTALVVNDVSPVNLDLQVRQLVLGQRPAVPSPGEEQQVKNNR